MAKTEVSSPKIMSMLKALIFSFVVTALLLLLLALLLYKLELKEGMVTAGIAAIYIISCFIGGFSAGKSIRERKFLWGLCVGGCYFLMLLGVSAILSPGAMTGGDYIVTTVLLCVGGGMLGGMLS
ncbi:TIGR04086 family membrane protein [Ruminococcus sp. OA3]|uniref:TIGR04086 family membrane protein n=1 Tax=Ruminococcus sp. OA3 TaxID=2914164 RepID=UPI001F06F327|nr:TIGR04086 family membrane protein [Ruminococcus sp. OA3]MCH1982975.1 TIGR04086 family membrane protein [Ruminococcus sp. OA3]